MKKLVLALVALAAAVAVATPALADYNFYGSMRFKTGYEVLGDTLDPSTDSTTFGLQSNSRFGLNATTGDIGGRVEMGLGGGTVATRLMYGTWKTDAGTLLIGQTYAPYWTSYSMVYQNDDGLNGFGELYEGRRPMIKFDATSGLYVAAIQNEQLGATATKVLVPKLNVGFKNKAGDLSYNVGVAFQQYAAYYDATFTTPTVNGPAKRTINSYLGYLEVAVKQEGFKATAKVHYGQNLDEFGFGRDLAYVAATNTNTEDYGGVAEVSVGPANVGFAYTVEDQDAAKANKDVVGYVNAKFSPVKGFSITPEIAVFDYDVNGFDWDGMDKVAATVKWQMDF